LKAALPISGDIAALAGIALDAIAAIESGRAPDTDWRGRAKELLDRQAAAEKAWESIIQCGGKSRIRVRSLTFLSTISS